VGGGWFRTDSGLVAGVLAAVVLGCAGDHLAGLCCVRAAWLLRSAPWLAAVPLALHAGWLSLAAFVNTAQVISAQGLLAGTAPLVWSVVLWVGAAVLALSVLRALGSGRLSPWAYVAALVWGLVAVAVRQSASTAEGGAVSAAIALLLAIVLVAQTLWLRPWRTRPVAAG
jgi:hypothetical protein